MRPFLFIAKLNRGFWNRLPFTKSNCLLVRAFRDTPWFCYGILVANSLKGMSSEWPLARFPI